MQISADKLQKIISEETDKVWNGAPEEDLVQFVREQIESTGKPLPQTQLTALTKALTYLTKATTKNTLIAWANVINQVSSDQK